MTPGRIAWSGSSAATVSSLAAPRLPAGAGPGWRIHPCRDRPARPVDRQRHLGRRPGPPVQRDLLLGSGNRRQVTTGRDRRSEGRSSEQRLRADGTIVDRNAFQSDPIHRVDVRIQQRIPLGGRVGIDGMFEIFNLLNHKNFGSYNTNESNANFGQPSPNGNIAYLPRVMQVGFRLSF